MGLAAVGSQSATNRADAQPATSPKDKEVKFAAHVRWKAAESNVWQSGGRLRCLGAWNGSIRIFCATVVDTLRFLALTMIEKLNRASG